MNKPLYKSKLTSKERFDQRTMLYFFPKSGGMVRVRYNDRVKMSLLSSRGIKPKNRTKGFLKLLWGKTYRDEQITQWKNGIRDGYITKFEVYDSVPDWLQDWVKSKLQDVPYDINYQTSDMFVKIGIML